MTICYFGMFAANYSRNKVLLKGLEENGVNVIRVNSRSHFIWGVRYLKLLHLFIKEKAWNCDAIFVGFPGQTDIPLAFVLGLLFGKKVIFDAFYSLYVSHVFDRKRVKEGSFRATGYWLTDYISCKLANKIVLDTNTQIDYFVKQFGLKKEKFHRIFVGTDTSVIKPVKVPKHSGFIVGFHGSFLPLQGVPVILDAAKKLEKENIKFYLLGNGVEFQNCKEKVERESITNVTFFKEVHYDELSEFISGCDIYLGGPFGDSLKSSMVIPNKVFEALAVKKPVIVGKSEAISELLTDKLDCVVVSQGDPKDLVKGILELKKNSSLREKIAVNGYNLVVKSLTPMKLGSDLINIISQ